MSNVSEARVQAILRRQPNAFVRDNFVNEFIKARYNFSTKAYSIGVINQICTAFDKIIT